MFPPYGRRAQKTPYIPRNPYNIIFYVLNRKKKPTVEETISRYQELGLGNVKVVRDKRNGDMVAHYGFSSQMR